MGGATDASGVRKRSRSGSSAAQAPQQRTVPLHVSEQLLSKRTRALGALAAQQQRRHVRRLGCVGRIRGRVMVQPIEARRHLRGRCSWRPLLPLNSRTAACTAQERK